MTHTQIHRPWEALYTCRECGSEPSAPDLLALFKRGKTIAGAKPALLYFDGALSYEELDTLSDRLASHLAAKGFQQGDRLGLYLQNSPAFVIGALAAWKLGGIAVPFNPMIRSTELGKLLPDCEPKAIVALDELAGFVREAVALIDGFDTELLLCSGHDFQTRDDQRVLPARSTIEPLAGEASLMSVLSEASPACGPANIDPLSPAFIVYTSGTTGVPKGVIITHDAGVWNGMVVEGWMRLDGTGPTLGIAPLFHITGIVAGMITAWQLGEGMVLSYRFHPDVVLEALKEHRPSFCVATITAYNALMSSPNSTQDHYRSFEALMSGGSPLPPALANAFYEHSGVVLYNGYGLTETTAGVTTVPRDVDAPVDKDSGALSIGVPTNEVDIWIAGDKGEALAPGEIGEIVIIGRAVSPGYWNKPEVSAEFMREDGFRTGDVGFMDESGWIFLVDRKKDMISASGFKVWPREVEDAIYQHPAIHEVAVVGVDDEYRGETVKAVVSLKPNSEFDKTAFIAWCKDRMAAYKVPKHVSVLADLPKTPSGKILRRELKDK